MRHPKDLRVYQWRAIKFVLEKKCAALFLDMGLGKTVIVQSVIKALKKRQRLADVEWRPFILVAEMKVIHMVWRQEAQEWSHTRDLVFSLAHGSLKQRIEALQVPCDIILMTPEGLQWLLKHYIPALRRVAQAERRRIKWPWQGLLVDESTIYKAHNTKRFQTLKKFLQRFDYRVILTGTPRPQSALDLWSQMYIVDAGQRLGTRFTRFKRRYFEQVEGSRYRFVPRVGANRTIARLTSDVSMRLDADDWISLPKIVLDPIKLSLTMDQQHQYEELEKQMYLMLRRGEINVANAAVKTQKCWQFANGAVYIDDPDTGARIGWEEVHTLKTDTLRRASQHAGDNLLVSYFFKHDLERIRRQHPEAITLGSNMKRAIAVQDAWNRDEIEMLLAHPRSASHGLNLQKGGHSVFFFSLTWSQERFWQTIYRLRRSGQTSGNVLVHVPLVLGTTDELMYAVVRQRTEEQRDFLGMLREYLKEKYQ